MTPYRTKTCAPSSSSSGMAVTGIVRVPTWMVTSGGVQDVAVPRGSRSPPRGDDIAVTDVLGDLEDGLSGLAGDTADVVEQEKAAPEQPPEPEPITVDAEPETETGLIRQVAEPS